jgi:hypothetical protein
MHIKSKIIQKHELSYMFQRQITILRETTIQTNTKLTHPIYMHNAKNK